MAVVQYYRKSNVTYMVDYSVKKMLTNRKRSGKFSWTIQQLEGRKFCVISLDERRQVDGKKT